MEVSTGLSTAEEIIEYEEIIVCPIDQDLINNLSHAYHDPFTGKYFHDRDEAAEYDQIMNAYNEEELADYVEEFGTGYKPWMGHA